jgi:hypothetical protein
VITDAGFSAIPAVAGVNNVAGAAFGGRQMRPGSDAVQLVVTNTGSIQRTTQISLQGSDRIFVPSSALFGGVSCPLLYIADHSAPNGAGRAHLAFFANRDGVSVRVQGALQFTAAQDSSIMCARVSTYWVDDQGWLLRSDLRARAPARVDPNFLVFIDAGSVEESLIAPDINDLQVAYRLSSEIYVGGPPAGLDARWAYHQAASAGNLLEGPTNQRNWFEVRMIRLNVLARTSFAIRQGVGGDQNAGAREDGPERQALREHVVGWSATSETLVNQRYFDLGAPAGITAEPY